MVPSYNRPGSIRNITRARAGKRALPDVPSHEYAESQQGDRAGRVTIEHVAVLFGFFACAILCLWFLAYSFVSGDEGWLFFALVALSLTSLCQKRFVKITGQ